MLRQKFRDPQGALVLPFNSERESLDSPEQEERSVWIHNAAKRRARFMNLVDQVLTSSSDAANQISMPTQVLRTRMQHDVNAEFSGALIDRSSKGAVNHRNELVLAGQSHRFPQINYSQRGIGRRFKIEQLGIRADRARVLLIVDRVYESGLNAQLWEPG